jgi:hypothetical protein
MVCRLIYQTHLLYYRVRLLNSDVHLVCRQALHPQLCRGHPLRRILRLLHLDVVRRIHLDDLRRGGQRHLDRQSHPDGLRRQVHLDVVRRIHLDDLRRDDPDRRDVRQRDEVRRLPHRPDAVRHCRMKMDYYLRVEVAERK